MLAEATKKQMRSYGYGFISSSYENLPYWGHGGGAPGMSLVPDYYPTTKTTLVCMSNRDPPLCDRLALLMPKTQLHLFIHWIVPGSFMMELYHNGMSVCSQKVRLVLREKHLRPAEHNLNLRAGDSTRAEYLKLNPNGVVPTLVDRGAVIV